MVTRTQPPIELTEEALKILYRELGVVNTLRFLNQFMIGLGDYTRERDELFGDLTLNEIIAEIKRDRGLESSD